ncbi:MAG TPA: molecular chaperone DnaJ [Solirubrobacteraceae bacterium]|jgi:molecular chaperone DnaJ|nr:molecular chaperone DnaJ [Solirubrobacteraceae bacterium]
MAARPDYYKTLGVDKKATPEEIKKAYRKLARQYHPDRNPGDKGAEARFKEISQAHDILGDPDKRKQYDSGSGPFATGAGPAGGFGGFGNFDFDGSSMGDILSNLFSGSASGRRVRTKPRAEKGADLEAQVSITFDQAVAGAQVPLQVPMHASCPSCHGTGAKPGTAPSVCPSCEGRGIETQGQGMFSISQPCSQCGGTGTVIEDPCPTCHGAGAVRTVKRLRVNIPAGVRDGSRIRLAGKGEPGRNGGAPGDLYLITNVSASSLFTRKGDNLEVEVPLSIPEALRGAEVQVPTLNGSKTLRVKPGTASGTVQRLRGEGPPKLGGKGEKGDIHYRFVIDVPKNLSKEQESAIEELSKTLDGDPRAGLFGNGAGPGDPAGKEADGGS